MSSTPRVVGDRLGYLLKHAQQRLSELGSVALEPYGINGRELAALLVIADGEPASQQEAAGRLGIDRTSMVAIVDALEAKGLVERRPHPADRRRNVIVLTEHGAETVREATRASDAAERAFLEPVGDAAGRRLKDILRALIHEDRSEERGG